MSAPSTAVVLLSLVAASAALHCRYAGVFPHPHDCTSAYTCRGTPELGFVTRVFTCPRGQAYSRESARCVDIDLVSDCVPDVVPLMDNPLCMGEALHCSDCSTLIFCTLDENGFFVNPTPVLCREPTPFCDPDARECTAELPSGCNLPGYSCTSVGYFPDTTKCDMYHVCYNNGTHINYNTNRCAVNNSTLPYYNSKQFQCSATSSEPCEVDCAGTIGIVAYPNDERFYAFCTLDTVELYSCPGNYRFNGVNGCEFSCAGRNAGMYADIHDCTKFYRCSEDDEAEPLLESCPSTMAFEPIAGACLDYDSVKCD